MCWTCNCCNVKFGLGRGCDIGGGVAVGDGCAGGGGGGGSRGRQCEGRRGKVQRSAFFDKPVHGTIQLAKDFVKEGHACQNARRFAVEMRSGGGIADDEPAVIESWAVFFEPRGDEAFVGWWEEVWGKAMGGGHSVGSIGNCAWCFDG